LIEDYNTILWIIYFINVLYHYCVFHCGGWKVKKWHKCKVHIDLTDHNLG